MKPNSYSIMARSKGTSIESLVIIAALSKAGFPNFNIGSIVRRDPSTISRINTRYIKLETLSSNHHQVS